MILSVPRVTAANQGRALALGYLAFCTLYLGAAALPLRARLPLEPSVLDAAIPFLAWTIWPYVSQFALAPAGVVLARDDADRSRVFYAMLLAAVFAAAVFMLWPTMLERPVPSAGGLTGLAWTFIHATDTTGNCMPSLHVALASLAGTALWRRGWRALALAWPALVAAATLTTKQHVAWDVAGGLLLAAAAWAAVPKLFRHERAQPARHSASA